MADWAEVKALLAEKRTLFLSCEAETESMCVCDLEELADRVDRRQKLLERAEELDGRIRAAAGGEPAVLAALNHTCDRQGLSPELAGVYDASMAVKAVANRILQNEEAARLRLETEKGRALAKIHELNASGSAVAAKYGKTMQGMSGPVALGREKKI